VCFYVICVRLGPYLQQPYEVRLQGCHSASHSEHRMVFPPIAVASAEAEEMEGSMTVRTQTVSIVIDKLIQNEEDKQTKSLVHVG